MATFGLPRFQLVLLRRMADHHPELVDDALRAMGATHTDLREAHRSWQARLRSRTHPGGEGRYRLALGPPVAEFERRVGDLTCSALQWPMPLWPDLRFEVLCAPGGTAVWNEWLVRAPGAAPPPLSGIADLTPWSCVVDDVARAFPPATPLPADAPNRARLAVTVPVAGGTPQRDGTHQSGGTAQSSGTPERVVAHFTWGLLQFVVRP